MTTIPLPALRKSVGAVSQETFLFSDTLAANVAFGRPAAPRKEVEHAVEAAGLAPDVARFPKGLDTVVGERGITLSGGQKQRTALARALMVDPRVLILDDALSAVDTYTEEEILGSLASYYGDRTVLIVSHRLSALRDCNLIVVLDNGRIVEQGNHGELLALGGRYAAIHREQQLRQEIEGY